MEGRSVVQKHVACAGSLRRGAWSRRRLGGLPLPQGKIAGFEGARLSRQKDVHSQDRGIVSVLDIDG